MNSLIDIKALKKFYPVQVGFLRTRDLHAVDSISLSINEGAVMGLVGESGSGKSTLGRCILGLERPTSGSVLFKGEDITVASPARLRQLRKFMQMVFQDPSGSLNPRMTVGDMVKEPLRIHRIADGREATKQVVELFERVGLKSDHLERYPHQLSGGQQQRVGIARALATQPDFIVLDEPTSALDVSIQAQLLHLFKDLQNEFNLTYLFISHDLSVVSALVHRVAVMYLGQVVEIGPVDEVFGNPRHPYTQALISAVPVDMPTDEKIRISLQGELSSAMNPPQACRLAPRCPFAEEKCRREAQPFVQVQPDHEVRCWKWESLEANQQPALNESVAQVENAAQ